MNKLSLTNGTGLLETLVVMYVISLLAVGGLVMISFNDLDLQQLIAAYAYQQHQAITNMKVTSWENADIYHPFPITFNGKGNVNISQTLLLKRNGREYRLIIYLGCGRMAIDDE